MGRPIAPAPAGEVVRSAAVTRTLARLAPATATGVAARAWELTLAELRDAAARGPVAWAGGDSPRCLYHYAYPPDFPGPCAKCGARRVGVSRLDSLPTSLEAAREAIERRRDLSRVLALEEAALELLAIAEGFLLVVAGEARLPREIPGAADTVREARLLLAELLA